MHMAVGDKVGVAVGELEGENVGVDVGVADGDAVGEPVGAKEGACVGVVGVPVGELVHTPQS